MSLKEVRLWLNYFDQSASRRYGRRLPKRLTIPDPKVVELLKACESLGYLCEVEEKRYPRTWYKPSALIAARVPSNLSKYDVIKQIGRRLVELRHGRPEVGHLSAKDRPQAASGQLGEYEVS